MRRQTYARAVLQLTSMSLRTSMLMLKRKRMLGLLLVEVDRNGSRRRRSIDIGAR